MKLTTHTLLVVAIALTGCGRVGYGELEPDATVAIEPASYCDGQARSCEGSLYCEDFDDAEVLYVECDGDDFQCGPAIVEADFQLVSDSVCAGPTSLEVSTVGGPGTRQNAYAYFWNMMVPNDFYVRFFLRVPLGSNVLGPSWGTGFFIGFASGGNWPRLNFGRTEGELRLAVDQSIEYAMPLWQRDVWHCVELHLSSELVEVWLDEQVVFSMPYTQLDSFTDWNAVGVGVTGSDADGPTHLQIDDFAAAAARLGCS
jgi:hypothetical protein